MDYRFESLSFDKTKGPDSRQKNYTPIRDLPLSQEDRKLLSIEFYSMKIKLLSVNESKSKKSSV